MKVGDLVKVRHYHRGKDGEMGILVRKKQHAGFRDEYIVKFPNGDKLSLTKEQCEVISESR